MRKALVVCTLVLGLLVPQGASEASRGQDVRKYEVAYTVSTDVTEAANGVLTCKVRAHAVKAYNIINQLLWVFRQKLDWCWNGNDVTDGSSWIEVEVHQVGWSYEGKIEEQKFGCNDGCNSFGKYRQGHFQLCLVYCVQHSYPWVQQIGYNDGGYTASGGG
jgi:hypothetical protein